MNTEKGFVNGVPRWIRVYDSRDYDDRYTVVFTGHYRGRGRQTHYLGVSQYGSYYHGESPDPIDRPRYSHLGKPVRFEDLPEPVQSVIVREYRALWSPSTQAKS